MIDSSYIWYTLNLENGQQDVELLGVGLMLENNHCFGFVAATKIPSKKGKKRVVLPLF